MLNWTEVIAATVSASLIGSLHCVGMCGPFAVMATHRPSNTRRGLAANIAGYHFGRLTTYLFLGTLAGLAGAIVNGAGHTIGMSHTAARVVGIALMVLGVARLIRLSQKPSQTRLHSSWVHRWTQTILAVGKRLQPKSAAARAYVIGMITTWLPCGWLYIFALAASSSGSILNANVLMFAFWIGTLPLLSMVSVGSESILRRFSSEGQTSSWAGGFMLSSARLQSLAAALMIAFGLYTYFHRSQIQLESLLSNRPRGVLTRSSIQELADEGLPCCGYLAEPGSEMPETAERP